MNMKNGWKNGHERHQHQEKGVSRMRIPAPSIKASLLKVFEQDNCWTANTSQPKMVHYLSPPTKWQLHSERWLHQATELTSKCHLYTELLSQNNIESQGMANGHVLVICYESQQDEFGTSKRQGNEYLHNTTVKGDGFVICQEVVQHLRDDYGIYHMSRKHRWLRK